MTEIPPFHRSVLAALESGQPPGVAAVTLGVEKRLVENAIKWMRRKGVTTPHFRPDLSDAGRTRIAVRDEEIKRLARELKKPSEIAGALSLPLSTVNRTLLLARRNGEDIPCQRALTAGSTTTLKLHRDSIESFRRAASIRGVSIAALVRMVVDAIAEEGDSLIDAVLDDGRAFVRSRAFERSRNAKRAAVQVINGYSNYAVSEASLRAAKSNPRGFVP